MNKREGRQAGRGTSKTLGVEEGRVVNCVTENKRRGERGRGSGREIDIEREGEKEEGEWKRKGWGIYSV